MLHSVVITTFFFTTELAFNEISMLIYRLTKCSANVHKAYGRITAKTATFIQKFIQSPYS